MSHTLRASRARVLAHALVIVLANIRDRDLVSSSPPNN